MKTRNNVSAIYPRDTHWSSFFLFFVFSLAQFILVWGQENGVGNLACDLIYLVELGRYSMCHRNPCRCMPVSRWSCAVYTRPVGSMIGSLPCFLLLLFLLSFWVVFRFCSWFLADVNLLVACVPKLSHAVEEYFCHSQFILEQVKRHGVYF